MKAEKRKNLGVTLYELIISMAIIAIISAMIVSISVFVSKSTEQQNANNDIIEELTSVREFTENWFSTYDRVAFRFVVSEGSILLSVTDDLTSPETIYALTFADGTLSCNGGGSRKSLHLDYVSGISVTRSESVGLYKFTLTYDEGKEFIYTIRQMTTAVTAP